MASAFRILCIAAILFPASLAPAGQATSSPSADDVKAREFVAAARRGDENAVRKSLEKDPGLVQATDQMGMTALDWAATREHWPIFRQLLSAGASVAGIGFDGGTVMHRVCHYDRPDMIKLLLDAGAEIGVQNQWGRTPLHVTARRGCGQAAALLLAHGVDPNVVTKEGWTSLHVAYLAGQPELVELLLAAGADAQKKDENGKLPAELRLQRPEAVSIEPAKLFEYQGLFDVNEHFHFKVWVDGDKLLLQDFGADKMYPTGPDSFYCRSEPWRVTFSRAEDGKIDEIEVHFLRRAVRGMKRHHPQYVGSRQCQECHMDQAHGNQYVPWLRARHAAAYWRLATDWALFLARMRPYFRDLENPREDSRCLLCHTTAAQDPDALFASTFNRDEGVGCESCHGPGSEYINMEIMSDREAFLAAGGTIPGEHTCRNCHRNPEHFDYAEWWPKIAHSRSAEDVTH